MLFNTWNKWMAITLLQSFGDSMINVANKVVPVAWPSKPEERAFGGNRGRGGKRGGRGRGRGRGGRKRRGT